MVQAHVLLVLHRAYDFRAANVAVAEGDNSGHDVVG